MWQSCIWHEICIYKKMGLSFDFFFRCETSWKTIRNEICLVVYLQVVSGNELFVQIIKKLCVYFTGVVQDIYIEVSLIIIAYFS